MLAVIHAQALELLTKLKCSEVSTFALIETHDAKLYIEICQVILQQHAELVTLKRHAHSSKAFCQCR